MSKVIWGAAGAIKFLANGHEIPNVTSITIPDLEMATAEIKGAGIMGTWALPIPGQISAMTCSVTVRAAGADKRYLMTDTVNIEIRIASTCRASDGSIYTAGTKIFIKGYPTKMTGGKGEVGSARDESFDYATVRYREIVDGEETILIDQIANVLRIGGKDLMRDIRNILN